MRASRVASETLTMQQRVWALDARPRERGPDGRPRGGVWQPVRWTKVPGYHWHHQHRARHEGGAPEGLGAAVPRGGGRWRQRRHKARCKAGQGALARGKGGARGAGAQGRRGQGRAACRAGQGARREARPEVEHLHRECVVCGRRGGGLRGPPRLPRHDGTRRRGAQAGEVRFTASWRR